MMEALTNINRDVAETSACRGKVAYPTHAQALHAVRRMSDRHRKVRHAAATPYRCKFCHEWHVGRRP